MNTYNIWLLVGRETEGNSIKNYILMNYNGCTQFVQKRSIIKFCREHEVVNVQTSGDNITGKGIAITALPRYVKQQGFGLQQVSGISQNEVIQLAQPLVKQYIQNKEMEQQKKIESNTEIQKAKQQEYVVNKLIVIEDLVITALAMKDITNELASNEHITRYIKQIDIDNAEGDSLDSLIRRYGVNGLVNGLITRLDRLDNRINKYNIDKNFSNKVSELKSKCADIKSLHEKTRKIIKDNKNQEKEQNTEIDDIPVIDEVSSDMIEIDMGLSEMPIVEDVGIDAIEVEQYDSCEISSIEDIFNKPEEYINDVIIDEEKLTIDDVINELFFSHDKYKTNKNKSNNDIIEEYRNWDRYGFKIVEFITVIYKHRDNKFRVSIDIPSIAQVQGFNVSKLEFPGNYAVSINRENINKAKEALETYISTVSVEYKEADDILYNIVNNTNTLLPDAKKLYMNLDTLHKIFVNQEIQNAENSSYFIDYINMNSNNILNKLNDIYSDIIKYEICTSIYEIGEFKKCVENIKSKVASISKEVQNELYEYKKQAEKVLKEKEDAENRDNMNNTVNEIKEDVKLREETIYNMVEALERIDIYYYLRELNDLCDDNIVVMIYKPVIEYLKDFLENSIKDYKEELEKMGDIMDYASENGNYENVSTEDLLAALEEFADI